MIKFCIQYLTYKHRGVLSAQLWDWVLNYHKPLPGNPSFLTVYSSTSTLGTGYGNYGNNLLCGLSKIIGVHEEPNTDILRLGTEP